jgi:type III secretion protein R
MSATENAVLLALIAIVPLVVLTLTSFVKLSVVLSLTRNAIGAPEAPSGLVVTGLSLVLTFFVMAPVAIDMARAADEQPTQQAPAPAPAPTLTPTPIPTLTPTPIPTLTPAPGAGSAAPAPGPGAATPATPKTVDDVVKSLVPAQYQPKVAAAERAIGPLKAFLVKHTRQADRETFTALATKMGNETKGDELWVLAPAFVTTELREAFAIAILIFVPFLVIDLIVALGLASLGLQMTSPTTVSLPLKLALFVAVDGWRLLLESLLRGYV